jgi:hypothetical protein
VSLMEMAYCFGENLKMYLTLLNLWHQQSIL